MPTLNSTPEETSTPQGWTRRIASATLSGSRPSGQDEPAPLGGAFCQAPVEDLARAGRGGVDEHDVGPVLGRPREPVVAGGKGLDDKRHTDRDVAAVLEGLVAVQLGGIETGTVHDLDDAAGLLVPEDPDRAYLRGKPRA